MDAATNSTEAILAASDAIVAAFDRFTNATRVLIWHLQPQDSLWSRVYGPCIGAVLGVTLGHLLVFFFTVYKMRDSEVDNNDGSKTMDNDKGLQRVGDIHVSFRAEGHRLGIGFMYLERAVGPILCGLYLCGFSPVVVHTDTPERV